MSGKRRVVSSDNGDSLIATETRGTLSRLRYEAVHVGVALAPHPRIGGECCIWLEVEVIGDDPEQGSASIALALGGELDPYLVAGSIEALADEVVRSFAVERGIDKIESEQMVRRGRRAGRIARNALARQIGESGGTKCAVCKRRPVSVIVDGVRLCKRCAHELGEMPHGKIGEES